MLEFYFNSLPLYVFVCIVNCDNILCLRVDINAGARTYERS